MSSISNRVPWPSAKNRSLFLMKKSIFSGVITFSLMSSLSGCSVNTTFDDNAYRSLGSSAPRNPTKAATGGISGGLNDSLTADQDGINFSATPEYSGQLVNDGITSGSGPSHVVRYGHGGLIEKIAKTAEIHCQQQRFQIKTHKQSFWGEESGTLSQCAYQFPKHCGGHSFAVLEYADKRVLLYFEPDSQNYIIDSLKGNSISKPGLWDKDDHLGTKTSNMGYLFETDYNQNYQLQENAPINFGWIIKASFNDEKEHGENYHRAIEKTSLCF